jgi:hypothetical protein
MNERKVTENETRMMKKLIENSFSQAFPLSFLVEREKSFPLTKLQPHVAEVRAEGKGREGKQN